MPRVAVTDTQRKKASIRGKIQYYMTIRGYTAEKIAKMLGVSSSAWRYKYNDPGRLTVEELVRLTNILQIPVTVNLLLGPDEDGTRDIVQEIVRAFGDLTRK